MMIERLLTDTIEARLGKGKAILLLGPRQVGKTTLTRSLLAKNDPDYLYLNGDEPDVPDLLSHRGSRALLDLFGRHRNVLIDEAQRVPDIGLSLKLVVDTAPDIQLIVTGSSSLELANTVNEPLTGRKYEYLLFPLAYAELIAHYGPLEARRMLDQRLIYGNYPEVVMARGDEEELLKLIAGSYLYRDLLYLEDIRRPELMKRILQALAFQVGSQVSYHEIAQLVGADNQTVERYIDLLEKAFIIFRLGSFSRNLRNELKRSRKIYFWDNGIRNALISNFNPPDLRQDIGPLWENYLVSERQKINHYHNRTVNAYFWRTRQQQEIDYLEEASGQLRGYEFTWNPRKRKKIPPAFLRAYPDSTVSVVTRDNFADFVLGNSSH
jgi:uncharacterized protein